MLEERRASRCCKGTKSNWGFVKCRPTPSKRAKLSRAAIK